jgi:hypothetical protein
MGMGITTAGDTMAGVDTTAAAEFMVVVVVVSTAGAEVDSMAEVADTVKRFGN